MMRYQKGGVRKSMWLGLEKNILVWHSGGRLLGESPRFVGPIHHTRGTFQLLILHCYWQRFNLTLLSSYQTTVTGMVPDWQRIITTPQVRSSHVTYWRSPTLYHNQRHIITMTVTFVRPAAFHTAMTSAVQLIGSISWQYVRLRLARLHIDITHPPRLMLTSLTKQQCSMTS